MVRLFLEVDVAVVAHARADAAGVALVDGLAAVVPWFERAMPTMPPYAVPLSATRRKYIVISTLRHCVTSAGSWMYMRGTEPLIMSVPSPSTS